MKDTTPMMDERDPLEEIMRAALAAGGHNLPDDERGASDPNRVEQDPLAAAFLCPESPQDYAIQVPRGITRDAAFEALARQWFHEAGLPQGIVNGIVREYCRCLEGHPDASPDEHRIMSELAREWGPDCARRIDLARAVIARCSNVEAVEEALVDSGLGNNPWLIRSLAALSDVPPSRVMTGAVS